MGKGTTFDAGGLYLKRDCELDEHRADMAGAAMVIAIIRAASLLSLPINLCSVLCLCENMPSGMACKPGMILVIFFFVILYIFHVMSRTVLTHRRYSVFS